ncbi:DUF6153 family protein [Streptomyces sp. NPDC007189]|uniref:DUF6153 family protein n=1 Tax=Streptomyces sp. NPDC007189 TaxID=3154315 RepID=UPI003453B015
MNVSRCVRAAGALAHLLLVVVLALGVFIMHTVGHPDSSSSAGMSTASQTSSPAMDHGPAAHDTAATDGHSGGSQAAGPEHSTSTHSPVMAMDMLSLCIAVMVGAGVLAALLRAALSRHPDWLPGLLARVSALQRPHPPPRGPDLTQLSVLRL